MGSVTAVAVAMYVGLLLLLLLLLVLLCSLHDYHPNKHLSSVAIPMVHSTLVFAARQHTAQIVKAAATRAPPPLRTSLCSRQDQLLSA
jgi:hypothetical protein